MEQEERWKQFASSGSVTDYLKYRQCVEGSGKNQADKDEGSREYGQNSQRDGDDINSISNQGI
ncbi:MAG: hypothetical protein SO170_04220 [Butyribacter sp.]|nr:hypothetical protein [bacterium]MDY3854153.1 hypothetical protein [Butyribacter sp.]